LEKELLRIPAEKQGPILTQTLSTKDVHAASPSDIRALWAQIRIFGQNRTETEKKHDYVAGGAEFEPSVRFSKADWTRPVRRKPGMIEHYCEGGQFSANPFYVANRKFGPEGNVFLK
jgi:hypothetical protein